MRTGTSPRSVRRFRIPTSTPTDTDKHGVTIKSLFTICKTTGIQIVAKEKKMEWNLRLEKLRDVVEHHIKNIPEDNEFEYLYYDVK